MTPTRAPDGPTVAPTTAEEDAFVAEMEWEATFDDATTAAGGGSGTAGDLFYDPATSFAWYAYNADRGGGTAAEDTVDPSSVSNSAAAGASSSDNDSTATVPDQAALAAAAVTPIMVGRLCAVDVARGGQVMEPCQEIAPKIGTATSTEIQAVGSCTDPATGSLSALAVVVHDSAKFLHFTNVLGSRLVVYKVGGGAAPSSPSSSSTTTAVRQLAPVDVSYEGWTSLYGEPAVGGRPAFSPDCRVVYATYITNPKFGGGSTVTVAHSVAGTGGSGDEVWRHTEDGNNFRRFVGFTPSPDGSVLYSATHVGPKPVASAMGVFALDAATGDVVQEYLYGGGGGGASNASASAGGDGPDDGTSKIDLDGTVSLLPLHNAYTNLVVDGEGNTYHVDSVVGLVKFSGGDLSKGPIWQSVKGAGSSGGEDESVLIRNRRHLAGRALNPLRNSTGPGFDAGKVPTWNAGGIGTNSNKTANPTQRPDGGFLPNSVDGPARAYRPALDASSSTVYYASGGADGDSGSGNADVVTAVDAASGRLLWQAPLGGEGGSNVVTDDTKLGPSQAATGGTALGVYTTTGSGVQCQDAKDGSLLWTYPFDDGNGDASALVSKVVVVSADNVLVAAGRGGTITSLQTTDPTGSPAPTTAGGITKAPFPSPTRPTSEAPVPKPQPTQAPDATDPPNDGTPAVDTLAPISNSGASAAGWSRHRLYCDYVTQPLMAQTSDLIMQGLIPILGTITMMQLLI